MEQETLIYIDDKEKYDASAIANSFASNNTKNRAYINALGAELAIKYLQSENISISNLKNMHSIKKILEDFDISDIMLPNIHMDVRMVFDDNAIFIPKSHFEYNLVPDIYIIFQIAKDFSHVKFLGFFEPKLINKNNQNNEYYFIEKEKLNSPSDLIKYINSFKRQNDIEPSEDIIENSQRIMISLADNDTSEQEKKYILEQLTKSARLRDLYIEYENFETLSFKAMNDPEIDKHQRVQDLSTNTDEFEIFEESIEPEIIEDVNDINTLIDNPEENSFDNDVIKDTIDTSIAGEIIAGAGLAAGLTAGISEAAELINTTEDVIDIAKDSINLADNLVDTNHELATDNSTLENIDLTEETINSIEDFDNSQALTDSLSDDNITEEIDTNNNEITETPDNEFEQVESLSLDNIDENIELENEETEIVDTLPLDNIDENIEVDEKDVEQVETLSLDNIDENIELESEETEIVDTLSLDNIDENIESLNSLDDVVETAKVDNQETITDGIADTIDIPEISEPTEYSETFGKNLLENLTAEEVDNIEIEQESKNENTDISPEDLLTQIDDVLNTSNAVLNEQASNVVTPPQDYMEELLNNDDETENENPDKLNLLFNDTDPVSDSETDNIESFEEIPTIEEPELQPAKNLNSKAVLAGIILLAALAAGAAFMFLKPKEDNTADFEPITNHTETAQQSEDNPLNTLEDNTPEEPKQEQPKTVQTKPVQKETIKEIKNNVAAKPVKTGSYLSVNKIVWDVPDTLSYSSNFQNYLRTAGKSIKLSLTADLLLANEYAYTNNVKVGLKMTNDGSIQESRIISSSGSDQIDKIVLQSVKDTLNVIKPPRSDIKDHNFNLNIIIYF